MTYKKKNIRASTRTHDPFFDNPKIWPTFIYRGEVPAHTFAKLPVRALINDPKKLFQKKVYVTIPQWFETFANMSDLRSGRNRAKCGLVLNDPIDWFKLRLNQPKTQLHWVVVTTSSLTTNTWPLQADFLVAQSFVTNGQKFCFFEQPLIKVSFASNCAILGPDLAIFLQTGVTLTFTLPCILPPHVTCNNKVGQSDNTVVLAYSEHMAKASK